jgi:radical SAM family uncharacterized protein
LFKIPKKDEEMLFNQLEPALEGVQKPARYIGGELGSVVKDAAGVAVRFALCFPDVYEIGMSHLGSKILYALMNSREDVWCERVYAPGADMEAQMRERGIPLYGLESLEPVAGFDMLGFTLQYELSYTAILNMLELAGLPVRSSERGELAPLVIAGGPCACNPEPLADFIDLFVLGEGEEVTLELIELYKQKDWRKSEFLSEATKIPGIYVPSLYDVSYHDDGTIAAITPDVKVTKRIVKDLDGVFYPERFIVPYVDIVHDRSMLEVMRGCMHGCRFCQAGFLHRPIREKSVETLLKQAEQLLDNTGYDEISLASLSTGDYPKIRELTEGLKKLCAVRRVRVSLPSLRMDSFDADFAVSERLSSLTFAPEAGTQRLRDVINKNITDENIRDSLRQSFQRGYTSVKFYFMIGLPTETQADLDGIIQICRLTKEFFRAYSKPQGKKKPLRLSVSTAVFNPKPFTPFQWEAQDGLESVKEKQRFLKEALSKMGVTYSYHDILSSRVEAALSRGDERLSAVILSAVKNGCYLDGWSEHFDYGKWEQAFRENNLSIDDFLKSREPTESLAWDFVDVGVTKKYLLRERENAHKEKKTRDCREGCTGCGLVHRA